MAGTRRRRNRLHLMVAVMVLAVGLPGVAGAADVDPAGSSTAAAPAVAPIGWGACPGLDVLQCATVSVPLDYARPTGARITLALNRLPALDPAHRLGSLFVNPGGPGGSGVDQVEEIAYPLSLSLRGRFDIVGFDPRGIARSSPLVCFTSPQELDGAVAPWPYPLRRATGGVPAAVRRAVRAARAARDASSIIDHMSTADVARDLDLLRAAVGDSTLTYLGYSYGTQLGTTYANMFPSRVRAVVLDGVLDPVVWTTGTPANRAPFDYRLHSDLGAQATLEQFFVRCDRAATDTDAGTSCSFGPHARSRFAALDLTLRLRPVDLGGGARFTEPQMVNATLGTLYSPYAWAPLSALLTDLEQRRPAAVTAARRALADTLGVTAASGFAQTIEGFAGVGCADSDNPTAYLAWPLTAAAAEAADGYFGRTWTWSSSACLPWPGRHDGRYVGPWTARTANPVLVVGNRFDPATRYHGAVAVSRLLPNSRLLTYAGWGHTVFMTGASRCVDDAVAHYLLTREVPGVGAVCGIEIDPFAGGGPAGADLRGDGGVGAAPRPAIGLPPSVKRALVG